MIPQLAQNPLVKRALSIFDADGDGTVDFKEFISALSVFGAAGDKNAKLECNYFYHFDANTKQLPSKCTTWTTMGLSAVESYLWF